MQINQMQPIWIQAFEETFESTQWGKVKQFDFALFQAGNLRPHLKAHREEKPNKWNRCDFTHHLKISAQHIQERNLKDTF